jgi:hypothetical protein
VISTSEGSASATSIGLPVSDDPAAINRSYPTGAVMVTPASGEIGRRIEIRSWLHRTPNSRQQLEHLRFGGHQLRLGCGLAKLPATPYRKHQDFHQILTQGLASAKAALRLQITI